MIIYLYMTSVELRQLNAYPEWKDNDMIQAVINYVQAVQNGNPNLLMMIFIPHKDKDIQQKFQEGQHVLECT